MEAAIKSIEQAVEVFSAEIGVQLTSKGVSSPKTSGNVTLAKLFDGTEFYGGMAFEVGADGVMQSCSYSGNHPVTDRAIGRRLGINRVHLMLGKEEEGLVYARRDMIKTAFLGVKLGRPSNDVNHTATEEYTSWEDPSKWQEQTE